MTTRLNYRDAGCLQGIHILISKVEGRSNEQADEIKFFGVKRMLIDSDMAFLRHCVGSLALTSANFHLTSSTIQAWIAFP